MTARFPSFDQFITNTIDRLKQEMPTTINTRRWAREPEQTKAPVPYHAPHRARVYVEPTAPLPEPTGVENPVAADAVDELQRAGQSTVI